MKTISNILRIISVVALMGTLYMLYKENIRLREQVNTQVHQIDSLKHTLYETQF
jgi:hypothetical protein